MNKLEEALKQIENRIKALQEKAAYIRQELGLVANEQQEVVETEPPKPRRGRRRTVNAE